VTPPVADDPDPDEVLATLGADLAVRVGAAVPGWVVRCVESRIPPDDPGRAAAVSAAARAGEDAAADVTARLRVLLAAPVDDQRATPLQVVRGAVTYPTDVLVRAGVPPVGRDRFAAERFPDDPYGLTPASLDALDPALAEPALRWGAAKAFAHRRRHASGERPSP
jgi:hypothetical protein